jgi:myo-inositol-1(or 4)-monophosphatase
MEKNINYLANIMIRARANIDTLVNRFPSAPSQLKEDQTPVTELDLRLSELIEDVVRRELPGVTFYSEEKFSKFAFPLLALDPLDGTQEYIEGRHEWAVSLGLFPDHEFQGDGWVYNPRTGECFSDALNRAFELKPLYRGEVSRSEWENGLFTDKGTERFKLSPVGSIAYKLGRLSAGKCDFVVSLRPKNIWDIAGGTLLCQRAGLRFYAGGREVTSVLKLYQPPLIWCHSELFSELAEIYP